MTLYIKNGEISPQIIYTEYSTIINPSEQDYIDNGFLPYEYKDDFEDFYNTYEYKVNQYIRERYSEEDEIALIRQRAEKPDEFNEYYNYCEECKQRAKGLNEEILSKISSSDIDITDIEYITLQLSRGNFCIQPGTILDMPEIIEENNEDDIENSDYYEDNSSDDIDAEINTFKKINIDEI